MIDTSKGEESGTFVDGLHFSKLKSDEKFLAHLQGINENLSAPTPSATDQPSTSVDLTQQVFDLIGGTNEFLRQLHPEMMTVHKTARDLFLHRFAELESIVPGPVDYARVALTIGNDV